MTKGINDKIVFNIINFDSLKDMWDKLKSKYSKVGQKVVYSILQELFNYPKINKLKKYNK